MSLKQQFEKEAKSNAQLQITIIEGGKELEVLALKISTEFITDLNKYISDNFKGNIVEDCHLGL